jgi:hypothetical protein
MFEQPIDLAPLCGPLIEAAMGALRVHCPISWPHGAVCLNDHQRFPCATYEWAHEVLTRAGWADHQIESLDVRTGPWS